MTAGAGAVRKRRRRPVLAVIPGRDGRDHAQDSITRATGCPPAAPLSLVCAAIGIAKPIRRPKRWRQPARLCSLASAIRPLTN